MTGKFPRLALMLLLVVVAACARRAPEPGTYVIDGKAYRPLTTADNYSETGIASWYGDKFHGRKTSNGEVYDMFGRTCAHKTLPLGTKIRVVNLENGLEVNARVNDRGPFVDGRIVDLSYTLARELEMAEKGLARVRIDTLDGTSFDKGPFTWQMGAFAEKSNAERFAGELAKKFNPVRIMVVYRENRPLYRVQVGRYEDRRTALLALDRLGGLGEKPWMVGYD